MIAIGLQAATRQGWLLTCPATGEGKRFVETRRLADDDLQDLSPGAVRGPTVPVTHAALDACRARYGR